MFFNKQNGEAICPISRENRPHNKPTIDRENKESLMYDFPPMKQYPILGENIQTPNPAKKIVS